MDQSHRHRSPVQRRARRGADDQPPGKHTLSEGLYPRFQGEGAVPGVREASHGLVDDATAARHGLVQFDPSAAPGDDADRIHALAEAGTSSGGGRLPHLDAIQRSFGHHDVGGVTAHVGGAAAEAATGMNARAYATGDRVAFASEPDLHLAAHEAAHVVQQRGGVRLSGGVGQSGDAYEQHADAVADLVVRGESAQAMLDTHAHRGSSGGSAVQREIDPNLTQSDLDDFASESDGDSANVVVGDAANQDRARQVYAEGERLFAAGQFVEAGQTFERAARTNVAHRNAAMRNAANSYRRAILARHNQQQQRPSGQLSDDDLNALGEGDGDSANAVVDGNIAQEDFEQGRGAYNQGDNAAAERDFQSAANRAPDRGQRNDLNFNVGMARFRQGDFHGAVQAFRQSLGLGSTADIPGAEHPNRPSERRRNQQR